MVNRSQKGGFVMGYYDDYLKSDAYLEHKLFGKKEGWTKKNHKYIERIKVKGKWKYFYSKASLSKFKSSNGNILDKLIDKVKYKKVDTLIDNFSSGAFVGTIAKGASDEAIEKREAKERERQARERDTKPQPVDPNEDYGSVKDNRQHKYIAKIKTPKGWRYFYDTKSLENFYKKHPEYRPPSSEKFPLKKDSMTPEEDMEMVNKNFNDTTVTTLWGEEMQVPGWQNNCYDCTLTYDARRRGYDVEAIYDEDGGYISEIDSCYTEPLDYRHLENNNTGSTMNDNDGDLMYDISDRYDEDAYGFLNLTWYDGSGHAIIWEKTGDEVIFRDCQSNEVLDIKDYLQYAIGVDYARTDDHMLSDKAFSDYLQPSDDTNEAQTYVSSDGLDPNLVWDPARRTIVRKP